MSSLKLAACSGEGWAIGLAWSPAGAPQPSLRRNARCTIGVVRSLERPRFSKRSAKDSSERRAPILHGIRQALQGQSDTRCWPENLAITPRASRSSPRLCASGPSFFVLAESTTPPERARPSATSKGPWISTKSVNLKPVDLSNLRLVVSPKPAGNVRHGLTLLLALPGMGDNSRSQPRGTPPPLPKRFQPAPFQRRRQPPRLRNQRIIVHPTSLHQEPAEHSPG